MPGIKLKKPRSSNQDQRGYEEKRIRIVKRDGEKCQFCHFRVSPERDKDRKSYLASGFLELHHLDDDHENNDDKNLITACPFCHQIFHVGFAGAHNRFVIIKMPWLTQAEINLFANCLFIVLARRTTVDRKIYEEAQNLVSFFEYNLHEEAVNELGEGIRKPESLGAALYALAQKGDVYQERRKGFWDIRLFPRKDAFKDAITYWERSTWHPGKSWFKYWTQIYEKWCEV